MEPLVSIIIPVHNSSAFLEKALEALLQQTYTNIEIIVVDDESKDSSYTIAKQFEPRSIKVLRQQNAGAAVARNKGLSIAVGNYIQFMDADDYLSADKIEKQVRALQQNPGCVAVCNYTSFVNDCDLEKIHSEDQSRFIYSSNQPAEFLIDLLGAKGESNFIQTNCWLVPRAIIEKSGGWRSYRCPDDDGEFFSRVLLASEGVVYVPGVLNYYRRDKRDNKLSSNSNSKHVQNTLLTIDLKYDYLKNRVDTAKLQKAFAKQYLDFAIYNYPQHKKLSRIAIKRYKAMDKTAELPLLGGRLIESIKNILGWRAAQFIKFHFR